MVDKDKRRDTVQQSAKTGETQKKKRNTVGEKMSDAFGLFPKQQMM